MKTFELSVSIGEEPELMAVEATTRDAAIEMVDDRGYELADAADKERADHLSIARAKRRIDTMLRRESQGRFRSIDHLITMPGYTPTLRNPVLADAYDAAQAHRGDARRACR